jgi:hypothetical protein
LFDSLGVEFDLDVASPGPALVPWVPARKHLTKRENGLLAPWEGFIWCNPPFGIRNNVEAWIERFIAHRNGVALVSDFTSTNWWHDLTRNADAICALKPKIQFVSDRGGTNDLGSTLVAIGERGVQALLNIERAGRGVCFYRPHYLQQLIGRLPVGGLPTDSRPTRPSDRPHLPAEIVASSAMMGSQA